MKSIYKAAVISVASVILTTCASITAYFSDTDSQTNKISIGVNTIEITEKYEQPTKLTPGTSFVKEPSVKCTEGSDCFVRVYCEFSDSSAEAFASLNVDTTNWVKENDGYYYYKKKLSEGESTTPLFTKVTIASDAKQETISSVDDLDLIVYAESVQAYDATNSKYYDTYKNAWANW